jgi:tripartite-type tricarboxylate transporter receptor subunit TctC
MNETLPGFEVTQWYGVLAPAGTAPSIIKILNREIARAMDTPRFAQQFLNIGADPASTTPEDFAALIKADIEKWGKVVKAAGIAVD